MYFKMIASQCFQRSPSRFVDSTIETQSATFVVSTSESSPEAAATSLPIWNLLQVDQGVGERLSVHVEHLTSKLVLPRPAQHQGQLEKENMELLVGGEIIV